MGGCTQFTHGTKHTHTTHTHTHQRSHAQAVDAGFAQRQRRSSTRRHAQQRCHAAKTHNPLHSTIQGSAAPTSYLHIMPAHLDQAAQRRAAPAGSSSQRLRMRHQASAAQRAACTFDREACPAARISDEYIPTEAFCAWWGLSYRWHGDGPYHSLQGELHVRPATAQRLSGRARSLLMQSSLSAAAPLTSCCLGAAVIAPPLAKRTPFTYSLSWDWIKRAGVPLWSAFCSSSCWSTQQLLITART